MSDTYVGTTYAIVEVCRDTERGFAIQRDDGKIFSDLIMDVDFWTTFDAGADRAKPMVLTKRKRAERMLLSLNYLEGQERLRWYRNRPWHLCEGGK